MLRSTELEVVRGLLLELTDLVSGLKFLAIKHFFLEDWIIYKKKNIIRFLPLQFEAVEI